MFNALGAIVVGCVRIRYLLFANEVTRWPGTVAVGARILIGIAVIGGLIWTHGHEGELGERANDALESRVKS